MKIEKPRVPNLALQQVREATHLTQDGFANLIDFSRAYIQAVELGQRDASPEFVHMTTMMTGVWPACIAAKWREAVDFEGEPYTDDTYYRFKSESPTPDSVEPVEIEALFAPAKRVILAAAKRGKAKMALYYYYEALVRAAFNVLWFDDKISTELTGGNKMIGRLTVGELRANSQLAAAVGFVDDPRLVNEEVIVLQSQPQRISASQLYVTTVLPQWIDIEQKYRKRMQAAAAATARKSVSGKTGE